MFTNLPNTLFVRDAVGTEMVAPGEPRLRRRFRSVNDKGMFASAWARVRDSFRLPEAMRVASSR